MWVCNVQIYSLPFNSLLVMMCVSFILLYGSELTMCGVDVSFVMKRSQKFK